MTMGRTWVAYVSGILAGAVMPALCFIAWMLFAGKFGDIPGWIPGMFLAAFLVALVHALILGAPYAALLRRFGRFDVLPMVIGGFFAGVLPVAILLTVSGLTNGGGFTFASIFRRHEDLLLFSTLGATGALAFYYAFRAAQPAPN